MQVQQSSQKAVIDWRTFNIGRDASVHFQQPSASAMVLNRVGADGGRSFIDGRLSANGQVWLLNPQGMLFGPTARVDTAGLLASTLRLSTEDFMAGRYRLSGDSTGSIINQGQLIAADQGYVALLAPEVRNEGVIAARLGSVALASGKELRLDVSGDHLVEVVIDEALVNGLIENRHLVNADGGWVLMSTDALSRLTHGAVNNSGIVQAQTIAEKDGVIKLLGGTTTLSGTLDASAPSGGKGGFVETSGHTVNVVDSARVTTLAKDGKTGTWLIDPNDYTIAASGGNITGAALSSQLASSNVQIQTATMGTPGNGDIFVNDNVTWTSSNQLELNAERNVNINSAINGAGFFNATAPGELSISSSGSVRANYVGYLVNDANLLGTTTATSSIGIYGSHTLRPIRIEATPTANSLSLTPAKIATLTAPYIHFGLSNFNTVTVAMPLDTSLIKSDLSIAGANVSIEAPIDVGDKRFSVSSIGTLSIPSSGSVRAMWVDYSVNDADLVGTTTATYGIRINPNANPRHPTRIEATPTANTLSLTPAEIATLTGSWFSFGSTGSPTTVAMPLDTSIIKNNLVLLGSNVSIEAPVDVGDKYFSVQSPGILSIPSSGSVRAMSVDYLVNDADLVGTTTTSTSGISISPYDSTRPTRIEATPTANTLSLAPAELKTLFVPAHQNIYVGNEASAQLSVTTSLDASVLNSDITLGLGGSKVSIDAPINFGTTAAFPAGVYFPVGSGGLKLNAPITASGVSITIKDGGIVQQSASAPVTTNRLHVRGSGYTGAANGSVYLDKSINHIAAVAGNITGTFHVENGNTALRVASIDGLNGITANDITLITDADVNLILDTPLVATGTGTLTPRKPTINDPLCTSPCILPHILLGTKGNFINNVGANALSTQAGRYWSIVSKSPSTTILNGLIPAAVSYDAEPLYINSNNDVLISANRVFYAKNDPAPGPTPTPTPAPTPHPDSRTEPSAPVVSIDTTVRQESTPTATTATAPSAIAPEGGIGSGGATLATFPKTKDGTGSSPPELVVNTKQSLPTRAGVVQKADLTAILQSLRDNRTQVYQDVLSQLEKNPNLAEVNACVGQGADDTCIAQPKKQRSGLYNDSVSRKIAVLIGNQAYRSPVPALETPAKDTQVIAQELQANLGYEVKVLSDLTRGQTIAALNDLIRNTDDNDSVLIFYAGHGYLDEKSQTGYWIPVDGSATDARTWISNNSIARALANIPAKQVMVVSDSCYSGSLTKEAKVTGTTGKTSKERKTVLTKRSVVALSSGGDEPVSDEGVDDHSIFAWNLIQTLKKVNADVSGQELHERIRDAVVQEFPQTPQYGAVLSAGHTEGGEYLLMPKATDQVNAAPDKK